MMHNDAYIGQQIGNYRLIRKIACGSFGCVYYAQHIHITSLAVAIKLLNAPLASQEQSQEVLHEANLLALLRHLHILSIMDAGIYNGFPYLITEYCSGGSLRDRIKQQSQSPLYIDEIIVILRQVADALQFAHEKNIAHRDLKPENILFNAKGDILLADFGIAKLLDTVGLQHGTAIGTPAYMAPEQFRGFASRESDQYALGCIAYELFTGQKPFIASDPASFMFKHTMEAPIAPRELNAQLPAHIEQAILKALAKEPEARFTNVDEFTRSLRMNAQQWCDEGKALYASKKYKEALAAFERAIQLDSSYADAYNGKCAVLITLKKYKDALVACEQAILLVPDSAKPYNNKSIVLRNLKQYKEALEACEQAIQLDSSYVIAYLSKGLVLAEIKQHEEALMAYEQAIQLDPALVLAYYNKGIALTALNRSDEALDVYNQVILLDPNFADAYYRKGLIFSEQGRYKESLEAFKQVLRVNPSYVEAYTNMGAAFNNLNQYDEALLAYEEAIRLKPNNIVAYYLKGMTFLNLIGSATASKYTEKEKYRRNALAAFDQVIQLNPNAALAHYQRGKILIELDRNADALTALDRAIQLDPSIGDAFDRKGSALRHLKRREEALEACNQAIRIEPENPIFYHNKSVTLELLGRWKEAQQIDEKARQLGYKE